MRCLGTSVLALSVAASTRPRVTFTGACAVGRNGTASRSNARARARPAAAARRRDADAALGRWLRLGGAGGLGALLGPPRLRVDVGQAHAAAATPRAGELARLPAEVGDHLA